MPSGKVSRKTNLVDDDDLDDFEDDDYVDEFDDENFVDSNDAKNDGQEKKLPERRKVNALSRGRSLKGGCRAGCLLTGLVCTKQENKSLFV